MSEEATELKHYGILRKSGRYPWGSGGDKYSRSMTFQDMVANLKGQGLSEKTIALGLGLGDNDKDGNFKSSITQLRDAITIAKETIVQDETNRAVALKEKQYSVEAIAKEMNMKPSTVRLRLANNDAQVKKTLTSVSDSIRSDVDKHQIVDIGKGVNIGLDVSPERYRAAIAILRDEGYETYTLKQPQPGSRNFTNQKVLVPKGTGYVAANKMKSEVYTPVAWSEDGGKTVLNMHPPLSVSSKRIKMVFGDQGGADRDGIVFVRPGVSDLSLGKNKYAQVRIAVDGTHYFKGVAIVNPDLPNGVDLEMHSAKPSSVGLHGALKPLVKNEKGEVDPDNPFGTSIKRQILVTDKDGKEKNTSIMNLVYEEGDWETWNNSLPSQMLAKQPQPFIRSQLAETVKQKHAKIEEINTITNPVLRRKLLEKEADTIDSDAVDLRAAAMPRQHTHVILPVPKMSPHEVYAPRFETGERVVLIRYPHGGRFEIPELTVNNNNRSAKKLLGNAPDAIGIHPKVAQRLSGADFDGDTVVVIPNKSGKVRGASTLGISGHEFEKGLNSFDPKQKYGGFVETGTDKKGDRVGNFKLMKNTGKEMGMITNLITDMSIQGAKPEHVVRAVRHSMVVIDAEKHDLDYRRSEVEHGIRQLKFIYQGGETKGATTLLSKATASERVPQRKLRLAPQGGPIDPLTGEKKFVPTGYTTNKFNAKTKTYDPNIKVPKVEKVKRLALTPDAHTLVSDKSHPVELIYADHANVMKGIANTTRLQAFRIPTPKMGTPLVKAVYKPEVEDLKTQLRKAQAQKPLERQANRIAITVIKMKLQEDPELRFDDDRRQKVEKQARDGAFARLGLEKSRITITDRAWDAIQLGAVSPNMFKEILDGNYVKTEDLYKLALPRKNVVVSAPILSRAKAMLAAGMTNADIAKALGVAPSTIRSALVREG